MKDLLVGLGLLCCPALVFVVFGTSGMEAFKDGATSIAPAETVELGRLPWSPGAGNRARPGPDPARIRTRRGQR